MILVGAVVTTDSLSLTSFPFTFPALKPPQTVTIPSTEMLHRSERLVEYHENFVQVSN